MLAADCLLRKSKTPHKDGISDAGLTHIAENMYKLEGIE